MKNNKEVFKSLLNEFEDVVVYSSPAVLNLKGGSDLTIISASFDDSNGSFKHEEAQSMFLISFTQLAGKDIDGIKINLIGKWFADNYPEEYGEKGMEYEGKIKIFENGEFLI